MSESTRKKTHLGRSILPPPRHGNRPGGWHPRLLTLVFVAVALGSISVGTYFAATSGKTGGNSTGIAASGPGQAAPAGTGSSAGGAASRTGALKPPVGPVVLKPKNPAHVAAWDKGQGGEALAALSAQIGTVLMAHGADQLIEMRHACVILASDVKTASIRAPIPDTAMQYLYKKALASLAAGAANCEEGISSRLEGDEDNVIHTDPALLNTAISELNIGFHNLYSGTAEIKTLKNP